MVYYLPAILLAIVIFLLSTAFGANVPNPIPDVISPDKIGHAVAYFCLTSAFLWGFYKNNRLNKRRVWMIILICACYGIALEIVQFSFFPNRNFEWWDMFANFVGATTAYTTIRFFKLNNRQNG